MKEALQQYKIEHEKHSGNEVKAILVGTRLGDPYSEHLDTFMETDIGWPKLMRVHPILEWNYDDIWEFLRCEEIGKGGIGWCELYDYGWVQSFLSLMIHVTDSLNTDTPLWAQLSIQYPTHYYATRQTRMDGNRHGN
jgi:3'-phosphoadenosine 5'-phosphosulfate sulfotransferase (PAPS reductase)/FAD synthetase